MFRVVMWVHDPLIFYTVSRVYSFTMGSAMMSSNDVIYRMLVEIVLQGAIVSLLVGRCWKCTYRWTAIQQLPYSILSCHVMSTFSNHSQPTTPVGRCLSLFICLFNHSFLVLLYCIIRVTVYILLFSSQNQ
jgi:hypothetical protein